MTYIDYIQKEYSLGDNLNDYLTVKSNELHYEEINLVHLAENYETPLEVGYTEMISKKIKMFCTHFNNAINDHKYPGEFIYAYATKANYLSEVVTTATNEAGALEITSSYDLDIIEYLYNRGLFPKQTLVLCNGFKHGRYFSRIRSLAKKGIKIIPIIENEKELNLFLDDTEAKYEIGFRLNVNETFLKKYDLPIKEPVDYKGRFGMFEDEMHTLAEKAQASDHLNLKLLHIHAGGTIDDIEYYSNIIQTVYKNVYTKLPNSLAYFDIGGGLPAQYTLDFNFNYKQFADTIISKISEVECPSPPDIIGEYGRYTVNDHSFMLFNVDFAKRTEVDDTLWYFVNSSLMSYLPDMWALDQKFIVLPLNGWEREVQKVRLGGLTCDPDDIYTGNGDSNGLYLPRLKDDEPLYIGIFGTGAYQEMIAGVQGVHHCLLPEASELIIYEKDGKLMFDKFSGIQSPEYVLRKLDYTEKHHLERYVK